MISKFINWNSKVNKYTNKIDLAKTGLGPSISDFPVSGYAGWWHCYLNFLTEERIKTAAGDTGLTVNDSWFLFKALKSFKAGATDIAPDGGSVSNWTNLISPSLSKTVKFPNVASTISGDTRRHSGFRLELESVSTGFSKMRWFDSIVIQLNKLDKAYVQANDGRDLVFDYSFKVKDSNSPTASNQKIFRIVFSSNTSAANENTGSTSTETYTNDGNNSSATIYQIRVNWDKWANGLILIDKELLKYGNDFIKSGFSSLGLTIPDYVLPYAGETSAFCTSFSFYMRTTSTTAQLEISNITLTNGYGIYLDTGVKYGRDNLTIFNMNKKTGSIFPEVNDHVKSLDGKLSLLHLTDLAVLDLNFFKNNINSPFYLFPYCLATDELSLAEALNNANGQYFSRANLEVGGLWIFDKKYDITDNDYDDYSIPIKLDEYK